MYNTAFIDPPRSNWNRYRSSESSFYGLALINKVPNSQLPGNISENRNIINYVGDVVREFQFKVNPTQLQQDEPAAVVITPTQAGGQFVEHQGQIYKDITIRGTTGFRPNRNKLGSFSPTLNPGDNNGIDSRERTGFDDLVNLINFFNAYYIAKETPAIAKDIIMVWQNGREGEYFVVEPITFRRTRQATDTPLTTGYEIRLRTIRRLEIAGFLKDEDARKKRQGTEGFYSRLNSFSARLADAFSSATRLVDTYTAEGQKFLTTVFKPVNNILEGLTGFLSATSRTFQVPRAQVASLVRNLTNLASALESNAVSYRSLGVPDQKKEAAQAFRNMARALGALHLESKLFSQTPTNVVAGKVSVYSKASVLETGDGGDPTSLSNSLSSNGVSQSEVYGGDTIRKIAKRLLGNSGKWKTLVVLNGLRPPYISPDGDGENVLRPGDPILFPVTGAGEFSSIAVTDDKKTLSPLEERLGRDIKLKSVGETGGITTFDFELGDAGDLALIEGVDNMIQAVQIKFNVEQGELALHPRFGIKYPLGVKAPQLKSFMDFNINARASLLADSRISEIGALDILVEGNTLRVNTDLLIKGFDSSVFLDFGVRR